MKEKLKQDPHRQNLSVDQVLSLLEISLKNLNVANSKVQNISVKKLNLLNGNTLECQFYAKSESSIEVKTEISSIMGALHGFFKDDSFENMKLEYYAARAYDKFDSEIMYAFSSIESAAFIGNGKAIDWMKSTIFQENTKDYRLSIAKRQISDIENALRKVIVNRLSLKHGTDWFKTSSGNNLFESVKRVYKDQFGIDVEDGNVLIEYTYILQLKKIICSNWKDFSDLFESKINFEEFIAELNEIRKEEAHNREITVTHLDRLKIIYEFMLLEVSEKYPDIIPRYLVDNWKIQLREIMLPKPELPFTDSEVLSETNQQLKLSKTVANLQGLINHINDKVLKLDTVVVPVQKKKTHEELLSLLLSYKTLHEELLEYGKLGDLSSILEKQKEIEEFSKKLQSFSQKYVYEQS